MARLAAPLAALLACLALAACGDGGSPAATSGATTTGRCAAMPGPEPLLIEERVERPQIDPYARRITDDGVFHEMTSQKVVIEGGDMRFETQPLEWRERWPIPAEAMDALRRAIRESGIDSAPAEVRPSGTSIGGSDVTYTACIDGRTHAITLRGAPDAGHRAADALKAALDAAVNAGANARHP